MDLPLQVRFKNIREIRMGSPYNLCEIQLRGEWIPPLPDSGWQNIKAYSPDGRQLALVLWNAAGNQPGFHLIRIDTVKRRWHKTRRIMGLCKKLYWQQDRFHWELDGYDD